VHLQLHNLFILQKTPTPLRRSEEAIVTPGWIIGAPSSSSSRIVLVDVQHDMHRTIVIEY